MWKNESYLEVVRITINRFLWSSSFVTKLSKPRGSNQILGYTWPDNSWGRFWRMYTLKCWSIIFRDRVQHFFFVSLQKKALGCTCKNLWCPHTTPPQALDYFRLNECSPLLESARCAVSVFFYYSSNGSDHGKKNKLWSKINFEVKYNCDLF